MAHICTPEKGLPEYEAVPEPTGGGEVVVVPALVVVTGVDVVVCTGVEELVVLDEDDDDDEELAAPGRHCEYQGLSSTHELPEEQQVGPEKP